MSLLPHQLCYQIFLNHTNENKYSDVASIYSLNMTRTAQFQASQSSKLRFCQQQQILEGKILMKINGFCIQKWIYIIQVNFWFINLLKQVARLGIKDLKSILFLSFQMREIVFLFFLPYLFAVGQVMLSIVCLP